MLKYFFVAITVVLVSSQSLAQKIQLINSGEVLTHGKASYDSGNYKRAIQLFQTIQERDTNYVASLAEMAITYLAMNEFDKVIEVCEKGLSKQTEFRPHLLRSKAVALDKKGDFEKSVSLFQKTIDEYPGDPVLIFNYGITLINAKEYGKAKDQFFRVLAVNPFHAGSHRALSLIAILEGRKIHGMLAMGVYLSINPSDNNQLVMVNNFVLNQEKDEGSVAPSGENAFDKLDQIIRAKMAMDKNFKSKFEYDYAVVRQFEMFFEQIDMSSPAEDRYKEFYLSFYKLVKEKGHLAAFVHNLIKSTPNEQVKKWIKKNDKALKAFYDEAAVELRMKRSRPVMPASLSLSADYTATYNDQGKLASVGPRSTDGKMTGKHFFFHYNMQRSAEGSFGANEEKVGTWKYYNIAGQLSKTENFDNGEVKIFHTNGNLYQHFFLFNDMISGKAEVMYRCGTVKERYNYKEDKRDGAGFTFFPDGKVESEFSYKEGALDGDYKTYYENGVLLSKLTYKAGKAEGPYSKNHPNGKTEIIGQFENDERGGEWKYFYYNGKPDRRGVYLNGFGIGEWLFYNERGELIEKRNFNQKGNFEGENSFYEGGKLHYVRTYRNDVVVKYVFYDHSGKEIAKHEKSDGTFPLKLHYSTGQMSAEGKLRKGENDGVWKYFTRFGGLRSEYTYKDGSLEGSFVEYYPGGAKEIVAQYKDGQRHGYYQAFYQSGAVKEEGWYQNGLKQQQWYAYYADGKIESDEYYFNDKVVTYSSDYSPEGALSTRRDYDEEGAISGISFLDLKGKPATKSSTNASKTVYQTYFSNGKPQSKLETDCGAYYGVVSRWFPDGKVFYNYSMLNNKRSGKFQYFDAGSQIESEGVYVDGWAEGMWKRYDRGRLDGEGRNLNNKADSTWYYYFDNGKVSSITNYLRGQRHGLTTIMNAEGNPAVEKIYEYDDLISFRTIQADGTWSGWNSFNGSATVLAFYPDGTKVYEEKYEGGLLTDTKRTYYPNGKVRTEYTFKSGDYNGPFTTYFPNGKVKERGTYIMDDLHGKLELFNEDGTPHRTENYHYGARYGKTIIYVKGGKPKEYTFTGSNVYE